jgi:hypothetical protein
MVVMRRRETKRRGMMWFHDLSHWQVIVVVLVPILQLLQIEN